MRRKAICFACAMVFFFSVKVLAWAQERLPVPPVEDVTDDIPENAAQAEKAKSVNIDMQLVYGQYNNMSSTINLSQEQKNSAYLLSSYFKRSNDFGYKDTTYKNTSYYENRIGYTGNHNITETWKTILDVDVYNDSRGMFNNPVYSREEKDKVRLSLKNVSKLTSSFEGYFIVGGSIYTHRLQAVLPEDQHKSVVDQARLDVGGEYIWSASNRVRASAQSGFYSYQDSPGDRYVSAEVIDDFNLTRMFGISFGANFDYNRDAAVLASPIVSLTVKGLEYATVTLMYRYDLQPFKPDEYYLEQKYISPGLDLPPARVHQGNAHLDVRINSAVSIKGDVMCQKSNNFYNYAPTADRVLVARAIPVTYYTTKLESNFILYKKILEMAFGFEFNHFDAAENITYRPQMSFSNTVLYSGKKWRFEWSNKLTGKVYVDPETDRRLNGAVIGYFGVQRMMMESFYAYIRVENIYNNKYNLREGYPEAGITFQGGLRILI